MKGFDIGETVICSVETKKDGSLQNVTTIVIDIYDPTGDRDVGGDGEEAESLLPADDTGEYHYDYETAGKSAGSYRAKITVTYGGRTTITSEGFELY